MMTSERANTTSIVVLLLLVGSLAFYSYISSTMSEKKTLENGIESSVEVLDKESYTKAVVSSGLTTSVRKYKLKIYIHKELREVEVSESKYNDINIGDTINVMLDDEKLVILDD